MSLSLGKKKVTPKRISEEKVNNASIYQRVWKNVMGWEERGGGKDQEETNVNVIKKKKKQLVVVWTAGETDSCKGWKRVHAATERGEE